MRDDDLKRAKLEHKNLCIKIDDWANLYYGDAAESSQAVSDIEFDLAVLRLKEIERIYPILKTKDSPTQKVGKIKKPVFKEYAHSLPMLSLGNVYNYFELEIWYNNLLSKYLGLDSAMFVAEMKIDGVAVALHYKKGKLDQALLRGDGLKGEDITSNILQIDNLPKQIPEHTATEIRGEIYFPLARFQELNQSLLQKGSKGFKNPRNAVAGSVRLKSTSEFASRKLSIICYDIVQNSPSISHFKNLIVLKKWGFEISPKFFQSNNLKKLFDFCTSSENQRENLHLQIDGVVIKLDDLDQRQEAGIDSNNPRWAKAWKFTALKAVSILENIEISVSRSGIITPIAVFQPINLGGTEVKRASLFNFENLKRLDLRIGDHINVIKSGDIIPYITDVLTDKRAANSKPISIPTNCPECKTKLSYKDLLLSANSDEFESQSKALYCLNSQCPAILKNKILHFVSSNAFAIDFLGSETINLFFQEGYFKNISDIFSLKNHADRILEIDGWGEKSLNLLLKSIEKSKAQPFNKFLYALAINGIGEKLAISLANHFKIWNQFEKATLEELKEIPKISKPAISNILEWLSVPQNLAEVKALFQVGVSLDPVNTKALTKGTIVITGTLTKPRKLWKEKLSELGYEVSAVVSDKTLYLIYGENPGSKLEKAKQRLDKNKKISLKILSEDEALNLFDTDKW